MLLENIMIFIGTRN
jgi:methionyl-tRNA synthetase